MSTLTNVLKLLKPSITDSFNLTDYNSNLDKIDDMASGWIPLLGTFTFLNATTITTSVNHTGTLTPPMKIRLTNGSVKYVTVKSVTASTIVLNEAILVSGTISSVHYSTVLNPNGLLLNIIYPTLNTEWSNWGDPYYPVRYWKDQLGFVHINGMVKHTSGSTPIFTLPIGYRPSKNIAFATFASGGTFANISINSNGDVILGIGVDGYAWIDCINYLAEQ